MTPAEQRLWVELRAKRFAGAKFRRQVVIGRHVADFACRTPRMLVVEVDGDTHADRIEYDNARTRFLEARGYEVIRFTNDDVVSNLDGVLEALLSALRLPLSPEGHLSPEGPLSPDGPLSPALSPEGEREEGW